MSWSGDGRSAQFSADVAWGSADHADLYPQIGCPCLVVAHELDLIYPPHAARAAANATDGPVTLSLKARDISGDDTLADHIRFTVRRDPERDGTFEATPVFSGTLPKLGHGTPLAGVELPAHSAWDYQVEATNTLGNSAPAEQGESHGCVKRQARPLFPESALGPPLLGDGLVAVNPWSVSS